MPSFEAFPNWDMLRNRLVKNATSDIQLGWTTPATKLDCQIHWLSVLGLNI